MHTVIAPRAPGRLVRPGAGGSKLRSRKKYGREGPKPCQMGPFVRDTYDVAHRGQSESQSQRKLQRRARSSAVHVRRSIRPHRHRAAIATANVTPARSHMRSHPTHMLGVVSVNAQDSLRRRRWLRAHAPPSSRLLTFERQQSRMHEQASAAAAEACSYVRKSSCDPERHACTLSVAVVESAECVSLSVVRSSRLQSSQNKWSGRTRRTGARGARNSVCHYHPAVRYRISRNRFRVNTTLFHFLSHADRPSALVVKWSYNGRE